MAKKVTTEMIKERLYDKVGDEYILVSDYERGNKKVDLIHKVCGEIYRVTTNHFFYDNTRCKCTLNTKSKEVFVKEFNEVSKGEYTQLSDYRRIHEKIKVKHNMCGHEYEVEPNSFLRGKRCPECFGNKVKTTEEFRYEVNELGNGEFELMSNYVNNRTKVMILHKTCDKTYAVTPKDFLRGNRCPYCKQSKGERMVQSILDELRETYEIQKTFEDLTSRHQKLPFDFYLPERNLLIEYDGVQHFKEVKYFGGSKKLSSQQRRDKLKNEYAKDKNIKLLRIPYTYKEEQVKKVIVSYL